ncbi:Rib/alpha-like domain-containing protein [Corynebacterium nasicanis]|uniref:Rib/alpha-like domain-containing protein n=1 Tax=Corynebacterium nasicanis TaxID=1448267 RepID=A0ABW1QED8_9CORY
MLQFKKRAVSVAAAVMIGASASLVPVLTPVAQAQEATAPVPQETVKVAGIDYPLGRYTDGKLVAVGTSPHIKGDQLTGVPVYEFNGETYPMSLEISPNTNVNGEQVYRWVVNSKDGNRSTDCKLDFVSSGVADRGLVHWSINGFLYSPVASPDSQYVTTSVQHFGDAWRIPFATGQALFNVRMEIEFPRDLPAPTRADATVFTPAITLPLETGGTLDVPEWTTGTPTPRWNPPPTYAVDWEVVPTGDPYRVELVMPYVEEGSVATIQYNQPNQVADVPVTTLKITADKFCYEPAVVQQGGEETMDPPTNSAADDSVLTGVTYSRTDATPEWAEVRPDGSIVLKPGLDVPTGDYTFPVNIHYPNGETTQTVAEVKVIPAGAPTPTPTTDRCVPTVLAAGIPLALLIPVALGHELNIPGLDVLNAQAQEAIRNANNQLQQGLGIHNSELAAQVEQLNRQYGPQLAEAARGVGIVAVGLLAAGAIADACGEEGSSGSSGSSAFSEASSDEDDAPTDQNGGTGGGS